MDTPKIRFPGFVKNWEKSNVSELVEIRKSYSYSRNEESEYGMVSHIHYGDIHSKFNNIIDNNSKLPFLKLIEIKDLVLLEKGDIILADASEDYNGLGTTIVNLSDRKDIIGGLHTFVLRPDKEKLYSLYFLNYSKTLIYKKYMQKIGTGASVFGISKANLEKLALLKPSLEEQQKIGDFFMLLDKRIEQQEEKIALLKDYKKAMIQRIFSQKIRFKDQNGNDYPDWEEKKLGEMIYRSSKKNTDQKYDRIQSISNKYGFVNQEDYFQDRRVGSLNVSNYYVINKGCFAYNPSRIDVGSLAYKHDNDISIISPLYVSFKGNTKHINDKFLLGWLFSHKFVGKLGRLFEGSVRNTLSYENLSTIDIETPCIAEQEKIALFLEVINDSIENQKELLDEIIKEKTALLNRMFI
jgi:type I restriction enzyme S subunit